LLFSFPLRTDIRSVRIEAGEWGGGREGKRQGGEELWQKNDFCRAAEHLAKGSF